jgi:hypothetical protein
MFSLKTYVKHQDALQQPFADIIDLSELTATAAKKFFSEYSNEIQRGAPCVSIEREIARRDADLDRLAQLLNCTPDLLKDSIRYYGQTYAAHCHTGLFLTCNVIDRNDFGRLDLIQKETTQFNYRDHSIYNMDRVEIFRTRMNILKLPRFMHQPEWEDLRHAFGILFLRTMHDHLHSAFSELASIKEMRPAYRFPDTGTDHHTPWDDITYNYYVSILWGKEPFLRQLILTAACIDEQYLEETMQIIETIGDMIAEMPMQNHERQNCHLLLHWMARYITPDHPEYSERINYATDSLMPHQLDRFMQELYSRYTRENPEDFDTFRSRPIDEMQKQIRLATQNMDGIFDDFRDQINGFLPKRILQPLTMLVP